MYSASLSLAISRVCSCLQVEISGIAFDPEVRLRIISRRLKGPWVDHSLVTSSCLCKKGKGAVLPLLIEPLKNRIDDSLHTGHVDKHHHRPGAASHFHEAPFDGIGGAQLAPQRLPEIEEREQLRQIALQPSYQSGILRLPVKTKALEGAAGLGGVPGQIDALGVALHAGLIAPPHAIAQIAHLVHPAALMARAGKDRFDRRSQTRTAIADHQLELTA